MQLLLILFSIKILALSTGIYYLRILSLPYKLLIIQILVSLLSEGYGYYLGAILHQNNIWVFYYYVLIECWLMGISGSFFISNKTFRKGIPLILGILTIVWLIDYFKTDLNTFSNKFFISYSILLIVIYIAALTNRTFVNNAIFKSPVFWVALSSILYYSCIIPYMGMFNFLIKNSPKLADRLFDINLTLNLVRYSFLAISFYLYGKQHRANLKNALTN